MEVWFGLGAMDSILMQLIAQVFGDGAVFLHFGALTSEGIGLIF